MCVCVFFEFSCWQPTSKLQSRKPHKPQNRPKIPARQYKFSLRQGIEKYPKNTRKIPRKYEFRIFWVFQGVFEGVFRGVSCSVCWGVFLHFVGFPILQLVEGLSILMYVVSWVCYSPGFLATMPLGSLLLVVLLGVSLLVVLFLFFFVCLFAVSCCSCLLVVPGCSCSGPLFSLWFLGGAVGACAGLLSWVSLVGCFFGVSLLVVFLLFFCFCFFAVFFLFFCFWFLLSLGVTSRNLA